MLNLISHWVSANKSHAQIPLHIYYTGKKRTVPNAGTDAEQLECPRIAVGNEKWFTHFGKHFGSSLESYTYI